MSPFDFAFVLVVITHGCISFCEVVQIYHLLLQEITSGFSQRCLLVQQGKLFSSREAAIPLKIFTDEGI